MRRLAFAVLSLIVTFGVFQLLTMGPVAFYGNQTGMHAMAMEDCPLGSVCPAQFESAQFLGSVSTPYALGLLVVFTAILFFALPILLRRPCATPPFLFTDSGPPALRSVFKKE